MEFLGFLYVVVIMGGSVIYCCFGVFFGEEEVELGKIVLSFVDGFVVFGYFC